MHQTKVLLHIWHIYAVEIPLTFNEWVTLQLIKRKAHLLIFWAIVNNSEQSGNKIKRNHVANHFYHGSSCEKRDRIGTMKAIHFAQHVFLVRHLCVVFIVCRRHTFAHKHTGMTKPFAWLRTEHKAHSIDRHTEVHRTTKNALFKAISNTRIGHASVCGS